jgi:uncharacterized protein YkwD
MRLAVLWVGMTCACATVPVASRHVEPPPISEPLLAPLTLSIAHPATAYNEPFVAPAPTPLADAVRAAMQDAAGTRGEIAADPRIDVACSELASVVSRDAAPSAALVEFALHGHGVAEPAAHVFVAWTAATPAQVIAAMRTQWGDSLLGRMRAGIGTAPAGPIIAIVVHATGVDLVATPRAVAAHDGFELTATIDPRVESPQLTITRDNGAIERPAVAITDDGRTLRAQFACDDHTGRQWIEIDATGLGGSLPRVVVPVLCGGTWPSSFAVEPAANVARLADPADIERRLTSIINRQRARGGLPLLRTDPRVAAAARRRARSLRDARTEGGVADASPPIERLRAAGASPLGVVESVLEVDSVGQAAEELMNEAIYRGQLESPVSTHVGIGVDATGGDLLVAITYVVFPPLVDAAAAARCLGDAIDAFEGSRVDPELSHAAQRYADGLASGAERAQLWPEIKVELATAIRRYEKLSYATVRAIDVMELDPRKLLHGEHVDDIGVGVAQSPRDGTQGGVTWAVVFLAERHRRRHWFDGGLEADAHRCLAAATR